MKQIQRWCDMAYLVIRYSAHYRKRLARMAQKKIDAVADKIIDKICE